MTTRIERHTPTKCVRLDVPHIHTATLLNRAAYPTWNQLLNRITTKSSSPFDPVEEGQLRLRCWIHDLVMQPKAAQATLLLTGPECSGKKTFHEALGLLLPDKAILKYPPPTWELRRDEWKSMLKTAWLMVIEGHPERFVKLFGHQRCRNGRFLKWLLTNNRPVDEDLPNVQRFQVDLLATTISKTDLFRRLQDERDAFHSALLQYVA